VLQPKVLNSTAWTLPKATISFSVPHKVQGWMETYQKYYTDIQNSRTISYRHDLSLVELNATYPGKDGKSKRYRISMTAPQACMLLLFNNSPKLTIPQMQDNLQIKNPHQVKQVLMTLLQRPSKFAKSGLVEKVLKKGQKSMPLLNTDIFILSRKFQSRFLKFELKKPNFGYVPPPPPPPRNYRLEAALVRTMKANRVMETKDLINEAMMQVKQLFQPDVREVKKVVEKLIKRAYMKRIEGSTKLQYLA